MPVRLGTAALVAAIAAVAAGSGVARPAAPLPGWMQIAAGTAGGTVWQGRIPEAGAGRKPLPGLVYLPPGFSPSARYPLLVLLHGVPGDAWSVVLGLRLAAAADAPIAAGRATPFVAVAPSGGAGPRAVQSWSGRWARWLVGQVVPWTRRALPVETGRSAVIAGLSSGADGAVVIGLANPRLFGTIEAWSGSFAEPSEWRLDGEAPLLRRLGMRFYLSSGTADRAVARATVAYDRALARFGLRQTVRLLPGGHDGRFWRAQLPDALAYAFSRPVP